MEQGASNYGLARIGQVALRVEDLERAVAFYRDVLGVRHLFTANGMAFFDCGGVRLMLTRLDEGPAGRAGFVLYFKVDDMREGYAALAGRGVRFAEEPELAARTETFDLWLACFRDSEDNDLCLMCEVPRA